MSLNLSKRLSTSFILFLILLTCLFSNKFLWVYLLLTCSFISFNEFNNLLKKIYKRKITKIYVFNFLAFIYLFFFINIGLNLYSLSVPGLFFVLLICIFSDTGGYIIGKSFGGRKLTKISPNKTISGSIGSFIFSLIPILFFLYFDQSINFIYKNFNIISLMLVCVFLSLICQLGDLFFSYLKRKAKVKDTGSILPGHGGLLDRIDGFIFVLPFAFLLNKLFLVLW